MNMKKYFIIIIGIIIFTFNGFANDPENESLIVLNNNYSLSDSEYDLSLMNLQVDVMGLVFFGPQVTLDFQFANMIAVGPYVRWHYAGVLYQAVVTDWFSDGTTTSLASYSFGAQAKFYIDLRANPERKVIQYQHTPPAGRSFIISYVANRGAREKIRMFLVELGYIEGKDFLCVA